MPTKGRDMINMNEKRGRSPSWPRKVEIEQQSRSPNPSSNLEREKSSTSTELRKIPIYCKPTMCSILYAQSVKKQYPLDKTTPPRRSIDKLLKIYEAKSTKSICNEKNITSLYTKTTGLVKPKDVGNPHHPHKRKNPSNVMEKIANINKQMRQPTKGLGSKPMVVEKKPMVSNGISSSRDDHHIITHEGEDNTISIANSDFLILEDCNKQHLVVKDNDLLHDQIECEYGGKIPLSEPLVPICLEGDQDMHESNTCSQDNEAIDKSVDNAQLNDHDDEMNHQDQADEICEEASDHHHSPKVDRENQELEIEQVVHEVDIGSNVVQHEQHKPKELEIEENSKEVPKEEDSTSKVLAEDQQVVAHGKKDAVAYNDVREETTSLPQVQRRNKVKALVGVFENVISLESNALRK